SGSGSDDHSSARKFADEFREMMKTGDSTKADELFDPNVRVEVGDKRYHGREQAVDWIRHLVDRYDHIEIRIDHITVRGDRISIVFTVHYEKNGETTYDRYVMVAVDRNGRAQIKMLRKG
uniref:Rd1NTF2_04 n=1 Tax=synthetic construct TaxID=32630 RepID=UPI00143F05EC|nr:Chain A, Rd1NTF2_04 [synthetic construct]6W3G_B Chain B, Rd1NTF2_04 [synthetic construct]